MMLPERLRVLIVDDSSDDALLIVNAITDGDVEVIYQRVDDAASLRAALKDPWDVAISDYSMPNLTAAEALRIVTEAQASLPFIVVSGVIGEDAAVQMMREGALDYVMKDRLSRLLPAIRREMGDVKSRKALETAAAARNDLEMQLRERDERYRQIVDNAQEGIWTIDVEGRTTFVNRSMSEMLGYEPDEMLGRHLHDFLYEADKDRADTLAVRRRLGFSDCDDFVLRARSGESVRIRFTANPLHDSGGTYIGALAMVTDVTARWDAEKTVIRQKKELDEAQRIAHLGSWRRDLPGDASAWSDGLFQIYGIDPATSPTMDLLFNLIFPDDRKRFVETITPSIERGLPVDMHYRIVRPDGAVRSVHTIGEVTLDEAGVPTHIRGVTQDVTERLQAAAEHQTLNRDVQLLLESTTQGIFGVDCDGYCTFINRAASEALGFPPGELVGRSMHDVTHQGADCNHAPAECPIESAARTGTAVEVQADRLCRRDGSSLPVEYSAAPIIDGGIVKGAVVVFTDVSERKLLQAQLEQSDRVSSLGRLAATMAHEFNNVLMGIQPFAEMLSRQNSGDSAQIATHNILQAVQRGRSITHGILRFARPAELVKETIDVTTWLRSMDATLTAVVGDRIRLGLRIDGEDLFIRGDRHQLEQVLTNLAANARDAMDDRGELAIVVERCLSGYVFPFGAIRTIDQYLHISMKDTGCGMDAKTLKAIFDPFFT
ncbi:MAG: PAS domain S-box protein, partial [Thermoanaerobaculia bacterium]